MVNPFDTASAQLHGKGEGVKAAGEGSEDPPKKKLKKKRSTEGDDEKKPPGSAEDGEIKKQKKTKKPEEPPVAEVKKEKKEKKKSKKSKPASSQLWASAPTAAMRRSPLGGLFGEQRALIVAPMVGGSELAFRLLCRKYGANLAYTPMIDSAKFVTGEDAAYLQTHEEDRPLVAHFCGNDPKTMARACEMAVATGGVDAVDLNLGCPQRVAHSGHFGSYLLGDDDRALVISIVAAMRSAVTVPVCVKIRLLDDLEATVKLVEQLRDAGADVVAIHARFRATWHKKGPGARDGPAKLDWVRAIKERVAGVVVVTNGNVRDSTEVKEAFKETGAHGVMAAEALLNDPSLFAEKQDPIKLALEYCDLAEAHGNPAGLSSVGFHIRRIARAPLEQFDALERVLAATTVQEARNCLLKVRAYLDGTEIFDRNAETHAASLAKAKARLKRKTLRRQFTERMVRKAKREKKPLDFYLEQGAETPTSKRLKELKKLPDKKTQLEAWNTRHKQHCFNLHLNSEGCNRAENCAFLHCKVGAKPGDDDDDDDDENFVAG